MRTLTAPLFQQFAILKHPIRYFVFLFLMILGSLHLAVDISIIFLNKTLTDVARLIFFTFLLSIVFFISKYFEQKKLKQISNQTIVP